MSGYVENPSVLGVQKSQSRCVMILGMHRSGTSSFAGSLEEAGLPLGNVLNEGIPNYNPKGYKEPEAIVYMHDNLLQANGGSWHSPPDHVKWGKLHTSVRDLFIESRAHMPLWGFKEPRTLIAFDGWVDVLDNWSAIGVFRNPVEAARSLNTRNSNFSLDRCFKLWIRYNESLLKIYEKHRIPMIEFSSTPIKTELGIKAAVNILGLKASTKLTFYEAAIPQQKADSSDAPEEARALFSKLQDRSLSKNF